MVASMESQTAAVKDQSEHLLREGYIVVKGVVDSSVCDALKEHILLSAAEAQRLDRGDLFGNIQEAHASANWARFDLKLDLCAPVLDALNQWQVGCSDLVKTAVGGRARLVELASITSRKGAKAQGVHADTMHGVTRFLQSDAVMPIADIKGSSPGHVDADSDAEEKQDDMSSIVRAVATHTALIYSSFIALQDVDFDMGPTLVWPATNTVEHHAALWEAGPKLSVVEADKSFHKAHLEMIMAKGDVLIYDSRVMHCGGENTSEHTRTLMVISCMGPGIPPDGSTYTMLPSLRRRDLLDQLPLPQDAATAPTATDGPDGVILPAAPHSRTSDEVAADGDGSREPGELKPIPPLEEWAAAVQCILCRRWRPCSADEAPKLSGGDGFQCRLTGFSCLQDQVYTADEIDGMF